MNNYYVVIRRISLKFYKSGKSFELVSEKMDKEEEKLSDNKLVVSDNCKISFLVKRSLIQFNSSKRVTSHSKSFVIRSLISEVLGTLKDDEDEKVF